jgi:hypothetical protein
MKPIIIAATVFVVMGSLAMHASSGFLHAVPGGAPVVSVIDAINAGLVGAIGGMPTLFLLGALTGLSTGLSYWTAARIAARPMVKAGAPAPSKPAPRDRTRVIKRREPEVAIVDPNRVAKVMGLATKAAGDGRFTV